MFEADRGLNLRQRDAAPVGTGEQFVVAVAEKAAYAFDVGGEPGDAGAQTGVAHIVGIMADEGGHAHESLSRFARTAHHEMHRCRTVGTDGLTVERRITVCLFTDGLVVSFGMGEGAEHALGPHLRQGEEVDVEPTVHLRAEIGQSHGLQGHSGLQHQLYVEFHLLTVLSVPRSGDGGEALQLAESLRVAVAAEDEAVTGLDVGSRREILRGGKTPVASAAETL